MCIMCPSMRCRCAWYRQTFHILQAPNGERMKLAIEEPNDRLWELMKPDDLQLPLHLPFTAPIGS